jgi:hypothetical protein
MAKLFLLLFWVSGVLLGSGLPGKLTADDLAQVVKVIGSGAAMRILRSAEPYPLFPGVKFGMELALFSKRDLNELGDHSGTVPNFNPVPRFYLAKGFLYDLEVIFVYFPNSVINTINTYGGMLKWSFYHESEDFLSGSAFFGVTSITAFSTQFRGMDYEFGALVSKDYTRVRPYLGGGFLIAKGTVINALVNAAENSSSNVVIHLFGGLEYELPFNLSFQADFMNFALSITAMVSKKF